MAQPLILSCISVTQPIGAFYLTVMKAGELLNRVDIHRPRGLDPASLQNVQRELSGRRTKEIAAYVQDPDATFPTSIIVSAYPGNVHAAADGTQLVFGKAPSQSADGDMAPPELAALEGLAEADKLGEVIDGQHRLMGLKEAGAGDSSSPYYDFELPVVFMLGLEPQHRAYVFSTINSKQTRVSSSLIIDLFGLATTRSPRKTCHDVAAALNATAGGPFFSTLKMLGKKNQPTESLTQGSFAKYLLELISRTADADERALKRGEPLPPDDRCPFRQFFIDERDDMIVRILNNYFSAVREVYPVAWSTPDQYALRRTVGFAALMKALGTVWKGEVLRTSKATLEVFQGIASHFVKAVPEADLADIPSSGDSAGKLAARLTAHWVEEA
jgi:DGQHR domain-containing protein